MGIRATILCVNVGPKYPMEYVRILGDMVARHLPRDEYEFRCLTDRPDELPEPWKPIAADPALPGWWQKVKLFDPALGLTGRLVYLDLDVCITGRLDKLLETPGIIRDWNYPAYNSSVMVWDAGEHVAIWTDFTHDVMTTVPPDHPKGFPWNDQDWITHVGGWATFPPSWCLSYRGHARAWPPKDAMVICFHGEPKPHDIHDGWVPESWKIGGLTDIRINGAINAGDEIVRRNIDDNCNRRPMRWFLGARKNDIPLVLIGGAPSLKHSINAIRKRQKAGAQVMATNGVPHFLRQHGITPDVHVILDARPENIAFLDDANPETFVLLASQCDPSLFQHAADAGLPHAIWHALLDHKHEAQLIAKAGDTLFTPIPGGSTVMLRSLFIAAVSGFKTIHVYGMDSSFSGDTHHAYSQAIDADNQPMPISWHGKTYQAAPWMIRQATEFQDDYMFLTHEGVKIIVHGDGLVPDICQHLNHARRKAA